MDRMASTTARIIIFIILTIILLKGSSGNPEGFSGDTSEVLAAEVLEKIEEGKAISYDGVVITGDLNINCLNLTNHENKTLVKQPIKIRGSEIRGSIDFGNTVFQKSLDFTGTTFLGNVKLQGSQFEESVCLIDAKFDGVVFMKGSQFLGYLDLTKAGFSKDVNAREAEFGDAYISNAQFEGDAIFDSVSFNGPAYILETIFLKDADFSDSTFEGDAYFINSQFQDRAEFHNVTFLSPSYFAACDFSKDADFSDSTFYEDINFYKTAFRRDVDFGNADFRRNASFSDADFEKDANFDPVSFSSSLNITGSNFKRFIVRWDSIKQHLSYDGVVYWSLIRNFKELEWFEDADRCYYQYRRLSQGEKELGISKIFDYIAWLSCGYGVRLEFTIAWMMGLILLCAFVFWKGGGIRWQSSSAFGHKRSVALRESLYFSAMVLTAQSPVDLRPVGRFKYLVMGERLMGWLLMALFLVVLGRMMIR